MLEMEYRGDWEKTEKFLRRIASGEHLMRLQSIGQKGVNALQAATPKRSGKTAASWSYEIEVDLTGAKIIWSNSNINDGVNIAVITQYGHGTRNGGYVQGIDYINPALEPLFRELLEEVTKAVSRL